MVPPPAGPAIDEVRRRWDPALAAVIDAHITVLRRVHDPEGLVAHLAGGDPPRRCRVSVGEVRTARPPERGGVFLDVVDGHGDLAALRAHLGAVASGDDLSVPHITLLHPRTTSPERRDAAWEELRRWRTGYAFEIDRLSLIGETGSGWREVTWFPLGR